MATWTSSPPWLPTRQLPRSASTSTARSPRSCPTRPRRASPTRRAQSCAVSPARYGLVACVSGRTGELAQEIVGVPELTYVGEHGLELDPGAAEWSERIHAFGANADWPVEAKPFSIAFHYRTAPDRDGREDGSSRRSRPPRRRRVCARAGAGSCSRCCRRSRRRSARPSHTCSSNTVSVVRSTPATTPPTSTPSAALDGLELGGPRRRCVR